MLGTMAKEDFVGKHFVAKVMENNDPAKLGRVKVSIPNVLDEGEHSIADLPWAIPFGLSPQGSGYGSFGPPDIGSFVYVEFQLGDIHYPVYHGGAKNPTTGPVSISSPSYPNRYGTKDSRGNHFYVDKATGDMEIFHFSGAILRINAAGDISLNTPGKFSLNAAGDVSLTSGGNMRLTATKIDLN